MKNSRFLSGLLTTVPLTLGNTLVINSPSYAAATTFKCVSPNVNVPDVNDLESNKSIYPKTIASTPRGDFPIIEWSSQHFKQFKDDNGNEYDPLTRCQSLERKFNEYYTCDLLAPESIASATLSRKINGKLVVYPVVLVTNGKCPLPLSQFDGQIVGGLLFMLPPEADVNRAAAKAHRVLAQLEDIRYNQGEPIIN